MSKTRKGSKGPGYDYGGSRLSPRWTECPGPGVKRRTHKKERREGKKELDTGEEKQRRAF